MIARLQTAAGLRVDARASPLPLAGVALLAAGTYLVVLGGTTIGETDPTLRLLNGLVGAAVIAAYLLRGPASMDRVDRRVLLALLLFEAAAVLSTFPRQSFDAALAALAYAAGLFVARGFLAHEKVRSLFIGVLISLSVVLTLLFAQLWLATVLEWWAGVDFVVTPPLSFELAGFPWGHRHDLTVLIVMLYPAWWVGRPSPLRRVAAVVIGMLGALLVVVDGSRIVWLAVAAATAVPALAWLARRRWSRRKLAVGAVGLGFVLAVLVVTGVGSALLERGLSAATVDWRLAMWAPLAEQWTTQPLAGSGPGSFPWILQLTGYFDTNSWAPRHPDSVFVQTLAEGGLLGIAAVAILVATLAPAILRSRSAGARWALTVFAVAAIGASPTDFAFLLVLALGWTAFALPRDAAAPPDAPLPNRIGRAALITAFAVVALAFGSFSVASFAYERARASVADGELDDSRGAFALARTLDPGLGLYPRQEGAVLLVQGAADLAERRLERAVGINPADDLAWRMLAMARDGQGDFEARDEALDVAIHLQRSDPTNLLLRARWAGAAGRESEAADALAEVVHAWPGVLYAPGWSVLADGAGGSPAVVANAATRWRADRPMPERRFDQGLWIATAADQPNLYDRAIAESPWSGPLSRAALAAMGCDAAADHMLAELPADAQRSTLYWELRARSSALASSPNAGDVRMLELMGGPIAESATGTTLNPLDENGLGRGDRWGYRRQSIAWPAIEITLPSPDVGRLRWMLEPSDATAESGLTGGLGACAP